MLTPYVCNINGRSQFTWNIGGNVGIASPNDPEDVQLVQLGYACAALEPQVPAATRLVFAKVVPGAPYQGGPQDPLTLAIKAHQKDSGGPQDGHVSVIRSATLTYAMNSPYMLAYLVGCILRAVAPNAPRIDRHPKCPALLKAAVVRCCD